MLMTVYNGGEYLGPAIESVLAQTFSDFELLVVDDASSDGSPELLQRFASQDPRVRVIRADTNGGPVAASNLGLAQARGALIARIDADDECRPRRLQRQVEAFADRPRLVLLGTAIDYIDSGGRAFGRHVPTIDNASLQAQLLGSGNPFCHSSVMLRADLLRSLGGYRQLVNRYALDYDMILRMADLGEIANLPEPLVAYRVHGGQITAQKMAQQLRSAHVYRALARRRRAGLAEDVPLALRETDSARGAFRDALVRSYLEWANLMGGVDPLQARRLRWCAVRTAPWHPAVLRLLLARLRNALPGSQTA